MTVAGRPDDLEDGGGDSRRPIEPIVFTDPPTPGGTARALPIFEWVAPAALLVDESYQRGLSEKSLKLIAKIVSNFDWARFKPPVAVLTDAGLELLDGQHTAIAAATHPDIDEIPVMIVEAPAREDRAAAFVAHNRDRVAITAAQLHHAAVAAGDEVALAAERVARAAGVNLLRIPPSSGQYKPGDTQAVTTVAALAKADEDHAVVVLRILVEGGLVPIPAPAIRAVDHLLHDPEFAEQVDAASITAAVRAVGKAIHAEAKTFAVTHCVPLWRAMAAVWFRKCRKRPASARPPEPAVVAKNATTGDVGNSDTISAAPVANAKRVAHSAEPAARGLRISIEPAPSRRELTRAIFGDPPPGRSALDRERVTEPKRDDRPATRGWSPGNHLRHCSGCGADFFGRLTAVICADCAYAEAAS